MKIKSNTVCFISERGHNGFIYPKFDDYGKTAIIEDLENIQTESWLCGHNHLRAVIVEASKIKDMCAGVNKKTVVWVDIEDIDE